MTVVSADAVPYPEYAPHVQGEDGHARESYQMVERVARGLLWGEAEDAAAFHHVGQYTDGFWDFTVDALAAPEARARAGAAGADLETQRADVRDVGRRLTFRTVSLSQELADLGTGPLIRSVYQSPGGVLVNDSLVDRSSLVGLRLGGPTASSGEDLRAWAFPADRAMGEEVTALRHAMQLADLQFGGDVPEGPPPALPEGVDRRALLEAAVSAGPLHYVAHTVDRTVRAYAQSLIGLQFPQFQGIPVEDRLTEYEDLAQEAVRVGGTFARVVRPAIGPGLARIVMDVEQGALFYYRLGVGEWLFGVTVLQPQVARADALMGQLATRWPTTVG